MCAGSGLFLQICSLPTTRQFLLSLLAPSLGPGVHSPLESATSGLSRLPFPLPPPINVSGQGPTSHTQACVRTHLLLHLLSILTLESIHKTKKPVSVSLPNYKHSAPFFVCGLCLFKFLRFCFSEVEMSKKVCLSTHLCRFSSFLSLVRESSSSRSPTPKQKKKKKKKDRGR